MNESKIKEEDAVKELYGQIKSGQMKVKFDQAYQNQILNLIDAAQKVLDMRLFKNRDKS